MGETLIRLAFSLMVVIGLIVVAARVTGKTRFGAGGRTQDIRVVSRQSVSRTASLTIAEVQGRTLLLGVTDQQISLLSDLTPASATIPVSQSLQATASPVSFAEHLSATTEAPDTDTDQATNLPSDDDVEGRAASVAVPAPRTGFFRASAPSHRAAVPSTSPLAGSVLSRESWRAAFGGLSRAS